MKIETYEGFLTKEKFAKVWLILNTIFITESNIRDSPDINQIMNLIGMFIRVPAKPNAFEEGPREG